MFGQYFFESGVSLLPSWILKPSLFVLLKSLLLVLELFETVTALIIQKLSAFAIQVEFLGMTTPSSSRHKELDIVTSEKSSYPGSSFYPDSFATYDEWVYAINCRYAWGPSREQIEEHYKNYVPIIGDQANPLEASALSHIEVGLASPTFVVRTVPKSTNILLIDVNDCFLRRSVSALGSHGYDHVTSAHGDITSDKAFTSLEGASSFCRRVQLGIQYFFNTGWQGRSDSIALNFVLHCVPGSFEGELKKV